MRCYAFEEIFAEKLRALLQRSRPRDLYDVVTLFEQTTFPLQKQVIRETLEKKCRHRCVPFPTEEIPISQSQQDVIEKEWERMLHHQMMKPQVATEYLRKLPSILAWLHA